jgi:hypothetical protein
MGLAFLVYPVLFENDAAVSAFVGVVLLVAALGALHGAVLIIWEIETRMDGMVFFYDVGFAGSRGFCSCQKRSFEIAVGKNLKKLYEIWININPIIK